MSPEHLRLVAFWVYLGAWAVLGVFALLGAVPRREAKAAASIRLTAPVLIGMLLQGTAALPITLSLKDGPLRPRAFELGGSLVLAPFAAALFGWVLLSSRRSANTQALFTSGPYAWLRHPIYLAFLAMLVATGLLTSAGIALLAAVALYVTGSELRIASEEAELEQKFPSEYPQYRRRTRWRYLPGIR